MLVPVYACYVQRTDRIHSYRVSVIISIQNWLSETPEQNKNAATPSYMSVFMSCESRPERYRLLCDPITDKKLFI
jgi:hypothetical protein